MLRYLQYDKVSHTGTLVSTSSYIPNLIKQHAVKFLRDHSVQQQIVQEYVLFTVQTRGNIHSLVHVILGAHMFEQYLQV